MITTILSLLLIYIFIGLILAILVTLSKCYYEKKIGKEIDSRVSSLLIISTIVYWLPGLIHNIKKRIINGKDKITEEDLINKIDYLQKKLEDENK